MAPRFSVLVSWAYSALWVLFGQRFWLKWFRRSSLEFCMQRQMATAHYSKPTTLMPWFARCLGVSTVTISTRFAVALGGLSVHRCLFPLFFSQRWSVYSHFAFFSFYFPRESHKIYRYVSLLFMPSDNSSNILSISGHFFTQITQKIYKKKNKNHLFLTQCAPRMLS